MGFVGRAVMLLVVGYFALDPTALRDVVQVATRMFGRLAGAQRSYLDSPFPPDDRPAAFLEAAREARAEAVARAAATRQSNDFPTPMGADNVAVFVRSSARWAAQTAGLGWLLESTSVRHVASDGRAGDSSLPSRTFEVLVPPKADFSAGKTPALPSSVVLRALQGRGAAEGDALLGDVSVTLDVTVRSPKGHRPVIAGPKRATFLLGKQQTITALERAVQAIAEARAVADDAMAGPVVGDAVRVQASADLCFGAKGFWRWGVLPHEDLLLDVLLLAAEHPKAAARPTGAEEASQ